jgi:hypothetical protein
MVTLVSSEIIYVELIASEKIFSKMPVQTYS